MVTDDIQPTEEGAPFSPLVGAILTQMFTDSSAVTSTLIDSLTEQLNDALATIDAIRADVDELLCGPYMPTSEYLRRALWPTAENRAQYRRDREAS